MSIDLDQPKDIVPQAVRLSILKIEISTASIRVYYAWKAADGSIIRNKDIEITGADYQDIISAQVTAGMVGKPVAGVVVTGVKNKIKAMLSLQGTVQDGF
ncbi:MAG: hypothetical protein P8013_02945 [Candidatus Sulfobium sp.]|jgi:hypothetical protein